MSAARKRKTNLERAGLTSTGTTTVRGPWGVVPVRVYVDSKGTRYVDRRDIERTCVPVPHRISDGAGGFIDFSVYVAGDDFCALAIEPLADCWRIDQIDTGAAYAEDARVLIDQLGKR